MSGCRLHLAAMETRTSSILYSGRPCFVPNSVLLSCFCHSRLVDTTLSRCLIVLLNSEVTGFQRCLQVLGPRHLAGHYSYHLSCPKSAERSFGRDYSDFGSRASQHRKTDSGRCLTTRCHQPKLVNEAL